MKHSLKITLLLLLIFIAAQFIGLLVVSNYVSVSETEQGIKVEYKEVPFIGAPPEVNQNLSFIPIMIAVLVGTGIIFLLIKFGKPVIFRYWIAVVVFLTLTISFFAIMGILLNLFKLHLGNNLLLLIAGILSLIFTFFKIFRHNVIAHNLSEVFIYGGIATVFVPLMNLFSVSALLILISGYDAFAVWKSGHMIALAKFQADSKAFAGLMIPYKRSAGFSAGKIKKAKKTKKKNAGTAILGGGDIAFPLMFAGVVMKSFGIEKAFIIPLFVAAALAILLFKGREDKFYPAMPFLTAGCFAGLLVLMLM